MEAAETTAPKHDNLFSDFKLDPTIHFLNHGSFGACPSVVIDAFMDWVYRSETQPVLFYSREYHALLREARERLAAYVGTDTDRIVYIPNATHGVNLMARSIPLAPGDEVLMTDHEYGACENVWALRCAETGASLRKAGIPVPYRDRAELVERVLAALTPKTRVLYLSHLTSPTALTFPVAEIVAEAKRRGVICCIDGAHAPGQIDLNLDAIGADFYTGNCHKWMCAPKGSAFLTVSPEWVNRIVPNVISWGTGPNTENVIGNRLIDGNQWLGTQSPCAALTVPSAIDYLCARNWGAVRTRCHDLLKDALAAIHELFGFAPIYPDDRAFMQLAIAELPSDWDQASLKTYLYDEHRVEVPIIRWQGRNFVRISVQGYNQRSDLAALVNGLASFRDGVAGSCSGKRGCS